MLGSDGMRKARWDGEGRLGLWLFFHFALIRWLPC